MSDLKEIHQKLHDYGVKMEALSKLSVKEAMHLLNYRKAKLKSDFAGFEPNDFIDESVQDNLIEQASKGVR